MFWAEKTGENSPMPIPQCPEVQVYALNTATRGSRRVVVASVAVWIQAHQEGEKKKEEMSSTLLLSILLSSKQPEVPDPFQSSVCRAECQPSSECTSPTRGFCPGWAEVQHATHFPQEILISNVKVCCQPTRASSANRCSDFAEKGYSCVPKTSCRLALTWMMILILLMQHEVMWWHYFFWCRPGGGDLVRGGRGGAWCPGWEEVVHLNI